jgi:hypothetical protein
VQSFLRNQASLLVLAFAPRVGLVDGALFNGRIDMGARQATASRALAKTEQAGVPLSAEETERMLGSKE